MTFAKWLRTTFGTIQRGETRRGHGKRRGRPSVETPEDRLSPPTLTVHSLPDNTRSDTWLPWGGAVRLGNAGGNAATGLGGALSTGEAAQVSGTYGSNDTVRFASIFGGGTIFLTQFDATAVGPSAFTISKPL